MAASTVYIRNYSRVSLVKLLARPIAIKQQGTAINVTSMIGLIHKNLLAGGWDEMDIIYRTPT